MKQHFSPMLLAASAFILLVIGLLWVPGHVSAERTERSPRPQLSERSKQSSGYGSSDERVDRPANTKYGRGESRRNMSEDVEVALDDIPTTMPLPVDIPEIEDMHDLMDHYVAPAHKKGLPKQDFESALQSAKDIEKYTLAMAHERFRVDDEEFLEYVRALYWKNQDLQAAIEDGNDKFAMIRAFKAQNQTCNACHKVYRHEDEEDDHGEHEEHDDNY